MRIAFEFFFSAAQRLALQFALTSLSNVAVSHFGLHAEEPVQARYREVYAPDSTVRQWAVFVFFFNITQNFASQMLSGTAADQGSRDLTSTSTNVNIVALFMYSLYSASGGMGDDLVASRRIGGGVSPRRYIMWMLTTPSLLRAVALRARLSSLPQASTALERPVVGGGGGNVPDSPREPFSAPGSARSSASWQLVPWQSWFRNEQVANIASLGMYVTGFLGGARVGTVMHMGKSKVPLPSHVNVYVYLIIASKALPVFFRSPFLFFSVEGKCARGIVLFFLLRGKAWGAQQ
jgi:hypothetical protein